MASAGSAQRNLTREEVISRVRQSLARVSADVALEEVISVVDGMADASGSYDPESVFIAGEACLRLWAERDQVGMVCLLRLSQERFVDLQQRMQEAIAAQTTVQAAAQAEIEQLKEQMSELRALVASQAKDETKKEGQPENKEAKTKKQLSEAELKYREAWGDLKDYDEAFEVLRSIGEVNDLSKFAKRSAEIQQNHDVDKQVQGFLPSLYSDTLERLGSSVKLNYQPFHRDLDGLMAFSEKRKPMFDEKVKYVAEKTKGKAIIPRMKGRPRCESKAAFKYTDATGTSWHRCTDIVRATILYDDLESMYAGLEVLEKLHKEDELKIIEFNDRYLKPMPGNYRDLQLSVKIDSMVCELQLNTKVMAFVKEHAGHRNFEVSRELIAAVKESNSSRCDEILRWGTELLDAESIQEILNEDKKPVLHEAAKTGNADLVSVFLDYRADVNLQSSDGQTALHKAMAGGFERAAWALICADAKFVEDEQGITPLMEGLLKLRVNPSDESIARAVSTVAQLCDKSEFDNLAEKMEALAQSRLIQSSELVVACKDNNFDKVERLLRDWADPNSVADELHVVHAALHGGRRDFDPDRVKVLRRVLEFRANPDATTSFEGETCTALEVALRSYNPRAPAGIAELVRYGAHFLNRCVRKYLPPWTAKSQEAEPQELVCHFLNTWPSLPFGGRELMKIDNSLMLKGCLPELLLFHGLEAAKQCDVPEEKKDEMAQLVANLLERSGHHWESTAVRADCRAKEVIFSKTFEDASKPICSVSFSPQFLAAGGNEGKVWIYDLHQDSSLIRTLHDASGPIRSVSWCGQWLATGGDDKIVRVYNAAEDFRLAKSLEEASDRIFSTAWSEQQLLAAAGRDSTVRVYNGAQDFAVLATLGDALEPIWALSWGGPFLAAGGCDEKVRVYDGAEEFRLTKVLDDATDWIRSVAWNGPLLASGCNDEIVRIYDASKEFMLIRTLGDASDWIRSVVWFGHLLAAAGHDKQVRLYNAREDFKLLQTLGEASDKVNAVSWRGEVLAAAGADAKLRIYHEDQKRAADTQIADWAKFVELATDSQGTQSADTLLHAAIACHALQSGAQEEQTHESLRSAAQAVAMKLRLLGRLDSAEELLQKYAVEDFMAIKTMADASDAIFSVSSNGHLFSAAGRDTKVRMYDTQQDFTAVRVLEEAADLIWAAAWSRNLLAIAGEDMTVRIYDADQDFVVLKTIHDASGRVMSLAWNAHLLAAGGQDKKVWVYDSLKEFLPLKTISDATGVVLCISWGEQLLAATGQDKTVRIYDPTKDFLRVKSLEDAAEGIWSLAWNANLLAVGGKDKQLRVYDVGQEFALVKTLEDASDTIRGVAWSGGLLAAGGEDKTLRVYHSLQDWALVKIAVLPSAVNSIDWTGHRLATGLENGEVRVLDSQFRCGPLEEARLWALTKPEQK